MPLIPSCWIKIGLSSPSLLLFHVIHAIKDLLEPIPEFGLLFVFKDVADPHDGLYQLVHLHTIAELKADAGYDWVRLRVLRALLEVSDKTHDDAGKEDAAEGQVFI